MKRYCMCHGWEKGSTDDKRVHTNGAGFFQHGKGRKRKVRYGPR